MHQILLIIALEKVRAVDEVEHRLEAVATGNKGEILLMMIQMIVAAQKPVNFMEVQASHMEVKVMVTNWDMEDQVES